LSRGAAWLWVSFRVIGSIITVPLAEELAFRGYLIRKLVSPAFETVRVGQFTWLSFVVSSVAFGLLHGRWLAGTLAGMAYAAALYRRGEIGEAVYAHMTTNALIAAYVLWFGHWSLWS
jgi:CAAX prenyl protease-like protein